MNQYTLGPDGKRVYTLKKVSHTLRSTITGNFGANGLSQVVDGKVSKSAYASKAPINHYLQLLTYRSHPARFSPDDKYSRYVNLAPRQIEDPD